MINKSNFREIEALKTSRAILKNQKSEISENHGCFRRKKSQVTIFIILGLIIVITVSIFFLLTRNNQQAISSPDNINSYVKNCLKTSLEDINKKLIDGNFYPNMTSNYFIYNDVKYRYLCKASQFYMPCVSQEPMLTEYLRRQIINATTIDMEKCFANLKKSLESKSYQVEMGNMTLDVDMSEEKITGIIDREIKTTKGGDIRNFKRFTTSISTPLYKFANHVRNIINFESTLCQFNMVRWMENYYDIKITKFVGSDQTKLYIITDRATEDKIGFAVKSCVLPAGI